jgi:DNA repair exonuclease SbcCD ATPase subunit|nr:MAG TPA: STRUCTURAL MAINTENANCE OF CHROMOSOMES PROTEIN [Caudoviricetes sp.]
MAEIKILDIEMTNFMAYGYEKVSFNDLTRIIGRNGVGKSTIANAYMWLLFDCDYDLTPKPVVRREESGVPVDGDVIVSATFDVDGKIVAMKKVQKRTHSKDGSSYKDDNKFFVNDVPKTAKDFKGYLGIDMDIVKMCCNINAFTAQKPDEMRKYLFNHTDSISDYDIAAGNEDLKEILPLLSDYTLDEITSMNKTVISEMKKELSTYSGRIAEKELEIKQKQEMDVSALELQKNILLERLKENKDKQASNKKLMNSYDKETNDILDMKFRLNDMVRKANEEIEKETKDIRGKIDHKEELFINLTNVIQTNNRYISTCKADNIKLNEERERLSNFWQSLKSEQFDEKSTVCPTCHRELPDEEIETLKSDFEKSKNERIKTIESDGLEVKKEIEENNKEISKLEELNKNNEADKKILEEEIAQLENNLSQERRNVTDTDDYKKLESEISEKEKFLEKYNDISALKTMLAGEETEIRSELAECEKLLMQADTSDCEDRLETLRKEQREKSQKQADAERVLHLIEDLEKVKNSKLADAVNANFGIVKWKLFEIGKSGGYKSDCIPMVDGKSILTTMSNKGNRIIGRIDICNSIQKMSGICCPIWIDDVESLDEANREKVIDMIESQNILLIVDNKDMEIMEG